MDGWSADQLKKMQLSGNGRLNGFLKPYGIDKDMDIQEKYNAKAAEASVECRRPCDVHAMHARQNAHMACTV